MMTDPVTTTCETLSPIVISPDGSIGGEAVTPRVVEFLRGWAPMSHATEKDEAESKRVGRKIRAMAKQCWSNARRAILKLDDYAQASYVEGWAVLDGGFMIEHGWIVRNALIIDPTIPSKPYRYFPGLEFRGRAGIAEFLDTPSGRKCKRSPFFHAFGWGGGVSPSYSEAFREGLAYVKTFCPDEEASR